MSSALSLRSLPPLCLALVAAAAAATRAAALPAAPQDSTPRDSTDSLSYLEFRNLGPAVGGGRVTAVAGIPCDPNTYYVGAAAGGVWKTTDGGAHWSAIFEKQPDASIGAVALAPSNPNVVWVGTGEANIRNDVVNGHGIYRSTDGGRSWTFAGLPDAGQIARIVVDPSDPDRAYAAVLGKAWVPSPERGVFRTADGGRTWTKVLFVNDTTGAIDVVMQPGNPKVLFAAMWQVRRFPWELVDGGPGSAIYRSTDGGDHWTRLAGHGLPDGPYGRIAIAIAPSDPDHVFALIEAKTGMLWESRDVGEHWTGVSTSHALDVRPFYFSQIAVAPTDDRTLYFSSFQLMQSTDGGHTVHSLDTGVHPDHHALWIDPANPARMIQGNDGGVYVSTTGGRSWRFLDNLPIEQFYMVAADARAPYRLCGGLQDNNAWCGPSNTLGPSGGNGAEWYTVTGGDGEYAVPAPSDSNVIYVDAQNGFITRLDLATGVSRFIRPYLEGVEHVSPAELRYRFNWTSPIAYHMFGNDRPYVFKTTDFGASWTDISAGLPANAAAHVVREDPSQRGFLVLGTDNGLWYSRDAGAHWRSLAGAFPAAPVFDLQFVPRTHDLVVATHGRGLFVLDDITPLEELTPAAESAALAVFTVHPATLWHGSDVGVPEASAYRAPNPPRGAVISYSLAKALEPTAAEKALKQTPVKIAIVDASGDTVYTGYGEAKQGINRFTWHLAYDGPTKLAFGEHPPAEPGEEGEPQGPAVIPGRYTAVVQAAGQTVARPIEVRADTRIPFDTAAARAQLAAGLRLRNEVSAMNEMLNGLHSLRMQIAHLDTALRAAAPNGAPTDTTVQHAAAGLDKKLQALMDTVYDPRVQRGVIEDDIHYLTRFSDQLMGLGFAVLYPYDQAPNGLVQAQHAALRRELDGYLARYATLLSTDVSAFNEMARAHGAPVLVASGPVAVKP